MRAADTRRAIQHRNDIITELNFVRRALSSRLTHADMAYYTARREALEHDVTNARVEVGTLKSRDFMATAYQNSHDLSESISSTMGREEFQQLRDIVATSTDTSPHGVKARALVALGMRDEDDEREVGSYE